MTQNSEVNFSAFIYRSVLQGFLPTYQKNLQLLCLRGQSNCNSFWHVRRNSYKTDLFEPMTSRSWQYISCPKDASPNHSTIRDLFNYNLDRSTTHPEFDLTRVWTHDLHILKSLFHVREAMWSQPLGHQGPISLSDSFQSCTSDPQAANYDNWNWTVYHVPLLYKYGLLTCHPDGTSHLCMHVHRFVPNNVSSMKLCWLTISMGWPSEVCW